MPITRYVEVEDLVSYGLNEAALAGIDPVVIDDALDAASKVAADYFGAQYTLPLESVGDSTKMYVSYIAAWILMSAVGFAPESGNDALIRTRYEDAMSWLNKVRSGMAPEGVAGAPGPPGSGGQSPFARPLVISSSQRGFSSRGDPSRSGGGFVGD